MNQLLLRLSDRYLRCVANAIGIITGNVVLCHGRRSSCTGFMNQFGLRAAMIEEQLPEYTLVTDKVVLVNRGKSSSNLCRCGNHRFSFREQRLGDSRDTPQGIKILDQGDELRSR